MGTDGRVITGATIHNGTNGPFAGTVTLSADGIACDCENPHCAFHDPPRPPYIP